jgi:hypothetical protein
MDSEGLGGKNDQKEVLQGFDQKLKRRVFVNRLSKWNPRAPDFKRKVIKRALWIDGWFIPQWMKDRFLVE